MYRCSLQLSRRDYQFSIQFTNVRLTRQTECFSRLFSVLRLSVPPCLSRPTVTVLPRYRYHGPNDIDAIFFSSRWVRVTVTDLSLSIYLSSLPAANRFLTYSDHLPLLSSRQHRCDEVPCALRFIFARSPECEEEKENVGAVGLSSLEFLSECEVILAVSMQARADYPMRFIAVENVEIAWWFKSRGLRGSYARVVFHVSSSYGWWRFRRRAVNARDVRRRSLLSMLASLARDRVSSLSFRPLSPRSTRYLSTSLPHHLEFFTDRRSIASACVLPSAITRQWRVATYWWGIANLCLCYWLYL